MANYKKDAAREFMILIKKLRDQDPEIKKVPLTVIEDKVKFIIDNIINESVEQTLAKLRILGIIKF